MLAPICLFVYNRPFHTLKTVESLLKNDLAKDSVIYIYSDYAKTREDIINVNKVRNFIAKISGFKKVIIIHRDINYGLSRNIIDGVQEIISKHGKVIVLEDDLITSPFFLSFMNSGLRLYQHDMNVASIHGYVYPIDNLPESFFLKGADCWGWATWDRAWKNFEKDGKILLEQVNKKKLKREINFNNSFGFVNMLEKQIKGKNDSWAIRWHISTYLKGMLTLYPGVSYVQNIGCDNSGQHSVKTNQYATNLNLNFNADSKIIIEENVGAKYQFEQYFKTNKKSKLKKIVQRIIQVISKRNSFKLSLIKNVLRNITPPFLYDMLLKMFGNRWTGNYKNWEDAKRETTGYNSEHIFNKVFESVYKVKLGIEKYERDSVIFDNIQYSWPLLSAILLVASKSDGNISVLDFGGSLGSSYYQNKKFLDLFENVHWCIIEQKHFVNKGKEFIQDDRIMFYESIEECLEYEKPNIIILSSVLQYIDDPYKLVDNILNQTRVEYVVVDRTPVKYSDNDRIVIQKVNPKIYKASYPCRIFNINNLLGLFKRNSLILFEEFDTVDTINAKGFKYKGFIFKREKK